MFSNSFKKFCDDSSSAWIQRLYSAGKRESSGNRLGNGRMPEGVGRERRYERTWKRGILATSNGIGLYRNQEREQKETGGGGGADTRGSLVTREWWATIKDSTSPRLVVLPVRLPPRWCAALANRLVLLSFCCLSLFQWQSFQPPNVIEAFREAFLYCYQALLKFLMARQRTLGPMEQMPCNACQGPARTKDQKSSLVL